MADSALGRVLGWLFGGEGSVATEPPLQVVVASTGIALTGIYAMSPVLSILAGPLGVTDAQVGAVITAYTAPSVVLVPVVGLLADRIGRKRLLVAGLVLFGLGGVAAALTTDFATVLALRAVQGVGFAAVNPLGVTIIGDQFAGRRELTAQGLRVAGITVAGLVVPPLAGVLVLGAWQYPFLLYGFALPVAAWAWVALPPSPPGKRASSLRAYLEDLVSLLRRPTLAAIQLSFVARFALSVGAYAYISVLLTRGLGASPVEAGLAVAGVGVAALGTSTQVGRLTAARDPFLVLFAGMLAVGAGVVAMGAAPSYASVGLGCLLLGTGMGVTGPVQKSLVTRHAPDALRGGAVSSALLFQSVGQAAGPLVLGWLVAWYGVARSFVLFGGVWGAAAALVVLLAYATRASLER